MRARIFQPARTAMQSGSARTTSWTLEFQHSATRDVDPLMGWVSNSEMDTQVRLQFDTVDAALAYAAERGIEVDVILPKPRKPVIRQGGYGENFATSRKGAWTH